MTRLEKMVWRGVSSSAERGIGCVLCALVACAFLSMTAVMTHAADEFIPCEDGPNVMPIAIGDIVQCSIEQVADIDLYEFAGVTGETIMLTLTDRTGGGARPCYELFDPNQQSIDAACIDGIGLRQVLELTMSGTYTILVRENGDNETNNYVLALQRIFPVPPETTALCYDCVQNDAIDVAADSDVFTFDGVSGETIMLTLTDRTGGGSRPVAEVFSPDKALMETLVIDGTGIRQIWELTQTGTYTILMRESNDDEVNNYKLALQKIFPQLPSVEMLCYDCVNGDVIEEAADSDVFTFDGVSGETIMLTLTDRTGGGSRPVAEVFSPDKALMETLVIDGIGIRQIWELTQTGTYTILMREANDDEVNNYILALQKISPVLPTVNSLTYSNVLEGRQIERVADSDVYILPALAGTTIIMTLTDMTGGGARPVLEVFDMNLQVIATLVQDGGAATWNHTFLETGEYILLVRESNDDETVTFNLGLQCIFGCPQCTADGDVNDSATLTAGDALCAFNISLSGETVPQDCDVEAWLCEVAASDVNCNGTLTAGDALEIFNRSLLAGGPLECFAQEQPNGPLASAGEEIFTVEVKADGDLLRVPVLMEASRGAVAFQFEVTYDTKHLHFEGISTSPAAKEWIALDAREADPGRVIAGGFDPQGLRTNAVGGGGPTQIAELRFRKLSDQAKLGSVEWKEQRLDRLPDEDREETTERVTKLDLGRPYPNPFRDGASATVSVPSEQQRQVTVAIYDVKGRLVETLLNETVLGGVRTVTWNRLGKDGRPVATGIYFMRMQVGNDFVKTHKLVVLK